MFYNGKHRSSGESMTLWTNDSFYWLSSISVMLLFVFVWLSLISMSSLRPHLQYSMQQSWNLSSPFELSEFNGFVHFNRLPNFCNRWLLPWLQGHSAHSQFIFTINQPNCAGGTMSMSIQSLLLLLWKDWFLKNTSSRRILYVVED